MPDAFERRFSAANLKLIDAKNWDLLIRTLNARLRGVEDKKASFEEAEKVIVALGLARINDVLLPAFQEIEGLANLGALFTATSETTVMVAEGVVQFTIDEPLRARFAPAAYLAIRAVAEGAGDIVMTGDKVDYDRATGTLTVSVDATRGEGEFSQWRISATSAPDFAIDTAAIFAEAQDAIDAAIAQLVGAAPSALDTLVELAAALGGDPNFATTVATALSHRLRFDAPQSLSSGERTQARANLGLGTAAIENAGTGNNEVLKLDGTGKVPAAVRTIVSREVAEAGESTDPVDWTPERVKEAVLGLSGALFEINVVLTQEACPGTRSSASSNIFSMSAPHGLVTGDLITPGGNWLNGRMYYAHVHSTNQFSIHQNLADAIADATRQGEGGTSGTRTLNKVVATVTGRGIDADVPFEFFGLNDTFGVPRLFRFNFAETMPDNNYMAIFTPNGNTWGRMIRETDGVSFHAYVKIEQYVYDDEYRVTDAWPVLINVKVYR